MKDLQDREKDGGIPFGRPLPVMLIPGGTLSQKN